MQGHEEDHRTDLKLHIVNKVGSERCTRYFYYLGRFLSQKVTKSEFDKSCHRLLGRENLPLHNKLIHSILRNASLAKSPPPNHNTNDHVPNGKVESLLLHCRDDKSGNRNMEKGDSGPFAYHRSSSQYADERGKVVAAPARILTLSTSTVVAAPLGGARRAVPVSNRSDFISCYGSGGLSDAEMLRKRMESIAVARGLGGVSSECSSMLNSMLDVYLKKLIKSCVDLSGARSTDGNQRNGLQIQTSNQPSDTRQEQHLVSLLDFRAAMELNPSQLGEHWPLLRERLLMRSFEEREGV
ncbi:hypothetical protein DY000_02027709 [Brassica cretica]|uniref:Transcriptional regulator of RNA polII, SAGA, subunit n=1 Tax=Brassica cretica TaxID=69181 RepID=A0ABQ7EJG6_BRACR|nr:hypothetical protein DY000_02027709 [Brassica cretica]